MKGHLESLPNELRFVIGERMETLEGLSDDQRREKPNLSLARLELEATLNVPPYADQLGAKKRPFCLKPLEVSFVC